MRKNRARIRPHAAGLLVGKPARHNHAAVRWYRRHWKRRGDRLEVVQDRLIKAGPGIEERAAAAREHAGHAFWGVADLDGVGDGWAVAVRLVAEGAGYVVGEVRVFPSMPGGSDLDGEPIGAAPMPCNACGQLMPQGPVPGGGITDAVFRSAKPMHYKAETLASLDAEARAMFAGVKAADRIAGRRKGRGKPNLLEIVLAVNDAYANGSTRANPEAGERLGLSATQVQERLKKATEDGIIKPPGRGHRGPREFTEYGRQLLEERNRRG